MTKLEDQDTKLTEHEIRLDQQQAEIQEIKTTVEKVDGKTDIIIEATKAMSMNIGKLNEEREAQHTSPKPPSDSTETTELGTIQKSDWKGTLASIVSTAITIAMTAWSLWSIMFGDKNPFFAYLSIICQPTIYVMVKTLTGNDIKNHEIVNSLKEKALQSKHQKELNVMKEALQSKMGDEWLLKEEIARLKERTKIHNENKQTPPLPKVPSYDLPKSPPEPAP